MSPETRPDSETRKAERQEAEAAHESDRPPTAEEEAKAAEHGDVKPSVAEAEQEMARKGAEAEGEGRIP